MGQNVDASREGRGGRALRRVTRAIPDAELDSSVHALASRLASFDKGHAALVCNHLATTMAVHGGHVWCLAVAPLQADPLLTAIGGCWRSLAEWIRAQVDGRCDSALPIDGLTTSNRWLPYTLDICSL